MKKKKHVTILVHDGICSVQRYYPIPPQKANEVEDWMTNLLTQSEVISRIKDWPYYEVEYLSSPTDWVYDVYVDNNLVCKYQDLSNVYTDIACMEYSENPNMSSNDTAILQPYFSSTEKFVDLSCRDCNISPMSNLMLAIYYPTAGFHPCICVVIEEEPIYKYDFDIETEFNDGFLATISDGYHNGYEDGVCVLANIIGYDSVIYKANKVTTMIQNIEVVLMKVDNQCDSEVVYTFS